MTALHRVQDGVKQQGRNQVAEAKSNALHLALQAAEGKALVLQAERQDYEGKLDKADGVVMKLRSSLANLEFDERRWKAREGELFGMLQKVHHKYNNFNCLLKIKTPFHVN